MKAVFFLIILLVVPLQQSHPMDCSIVSSEMVLSYYKENTNGIHDEMRGNVPEDTGISGDKVKEAFTSRGYDADWISVYPLDFKNSIKKELKEKDPVISIVKTSEGFYHAVVIIGMSEKNIYYIDPIDGKKDKKNINDFIDWSLTENGIYIFVVKNKKTN